MIGRVLFAVLLVALGGQAWAQAAGDYFADPKSRCKLWWPSKDPYYHDGKVTATYTVAAVKWNGACTRGMAQGRATFEIVENYRYTGEKPVPTAYQGEGDFVDGKLSGRGFYVGTSNDSFHKVRVEGEFRDGALNGRGIRTATTSAETVSYRSGTKTVPVDDTLRFEGDFRDGKPNGYGVQTQTGVSDGKPYERRWEGDWKNGNLDGRGKYVDGRKGCKASMRYEGEWAAGDFHGRGTLTTFSGKVYSGVFENGKLGGKDAFYDLGDRSEVVDRICG